MRSLALCAALALGGCLSMLPDDSTHSQATVDGGDDGAAPGDLAQSSTGGGGDLAQSPAGGDLAGAPAGGAAFGATCTVASDCASGYCEPFGIGGNLCTKPCTNLGLPDPACPNNGQCNQKGFCKAN